MKRIVTAAIILLISSLAFAGPPGSPPNGWSNSAYGPYTAGGTNQGVTAHGTVTSGTVTFTPGVHTITVGGDQIWAFSGWPTTGIEGQVTIYVTNGGAFTITGLATPIYSGGGAPALTASGKDTLVYTSTDGGTTINGYLTGLDMKH